MFLQLAASILLIVGVVLLVAPRYIELLKRRKRPQPKESRGPELIRLLLPQVRQLAGYARRLPLAGFRKHYAHMIERAGLPFELSADEFFAISGATGLVTTVGAFLIHITLYQNLAVAVLLSFGGLIYPHLSLSAAVRKHENACLRALPDFLDLLALSVEAGMGFDSAVLNLTGVLERGPLTSRFEEYLRNVNVGKTRTEALRETARKLDLPEFTAFANAVVQATETGATLAPVLKTASLELLSRRFERAEKKAQELPVKILFPLFVFVFPATFLMILVPLFLRIMESGALGEF